METLRTAFQSYFNTPGLELPQELPPQGILNGGGWLVKFVLCEDSSGDFYLDCFAQHRQTNSRHFRILSNGEIQSLENFQENLIFNQETGDNWGMARMLMDQHNQKVRTVLESKGLWLDGEMVN